MKEGHIHLFMRSYLSTNGWRLIAGEYPGGSDHHLYPLNVIDPALARDGSPDPRRHSRGELIPDLVALKGRNLLVIEAKPAFNLTDQEKLRTLVADRKADLLMALDKFARERGFPELLPVESLSLLPALAFGRPAPDRTPPAGFSFLLVVSREKAYFSGEAERLS